MKLQYLATWCKELTHLKRPWCWARLKAGEEMDDRGWDGWMASPTQWTWVWINSRSRWWIWRPGVLQSRELQRVRHDWVNKLYWIIVSPFYERENWTCRSYIFCPWSHSWQERQDWNPHCLPTEYVLLTTILW